MGNSAGKDHGGLAVSEAMQTLLEGPATSVFEEEGGVWDSVFASREMDADAFFEGFAVPDVVEMGEFQPGNLKLLARKAISNISYFMETKKKDPPLPVVLSSIRILSRALPVMLSEPSLKKWCWKRQRLSNFLTYMEKEEDASPTGGGDDKKVNGVGDKVAVVATRDGEESGGGVDDEDGDEREEKGSVRGGKSNFPICFASVVIHTLVGFLSFPGFAVDDEASDWDDFYTPIPASYYGIREASLIWAPGIAVTDHNMREVSHLNAHRIELLRLLVSALSTPLYLKAPSKAEVDHVGSEEMLRLADLRSAEPSVNAVSLSEPGSSLPPKPPIAADTTLGARLDNPLARLAVSRHLPFATELFYSLLNVAAIEVNPANSANTEAGGYSRKSRPSAWRLGFGARTVTAEDKSLSLVEWAMQALALLLRHGRPYRDLLHEKGVFLKEDEPLTFGSIPSLVAQAIERDVEYNCHRRCVYVIHSDEDLDRIALGLLRHMNDARLGKTRREESPLSTHQEALMVFSAFVHENPRFIGRLAASEELARGSAVCVCHILEDAANAMLEHGDPMEFDELRGDEGGDSGFDPSDPEIGGGNSGGTRERKKPEGSGAGASSGGDEGGIEAAEGKESGSGRLPPGEDVGLVVLASRLLLALSEDEGWMSTLAFLPTGGRRGEFTATFLETEPGMNLADVVVTMAAWALARGSDGVSAAAPALAAVARNGCPYLVGGMRGHTADLMLDGVEINLRAVASTPTSASSVSAASGGGMGGEVLKESPGGGTSAGVASLLLEGLAAALAFHYEDKGELVLSLVKRSTAPRHRGSTRADVEPQRSGADGFHGSLGGVTSGGFGGGHGGGVLHWLAAQGGMLRDGSEKEWSVSHPVSLGSGEGVSPESWFRVVPVASPWEGWPMRRVLWPMVSTVIGSASQGTAVLGAGGVGESVAGHSPAVVEAEIQLILSRARGTILCPLGLWPSSWDEDLVAIADPKERGLSGSGASRPRRMENGGGEAHGKAGGEAAGGAVELAPRMGVVASALKVVRASGAATVMPLDVSVVEAGREETTAEEAVAVAAATGTAFRALHDSAGTPMKWSGVASRGGGVRKGAGRMDWVSTGGDMVDGEPGGEGGGCSSGGVGLTRVVATEEPWQTAYLWSLLYLKTEAEMPLFDRHAVKLFEEIEEFGTAESANAPGNGTLSIQAPNDRLFLVNGQGSGGEDLEGGLYHHGNEEEKCNGGTTESSDAGGKPYSAALPGQAATKEGSGLVQSGGDGSGGKASVRGLIFRTSRGSANGGGGGPVPAEEAERNFDGVFSAGGGRAGELV